MKKMQATPNKNTKVSKSQKQYGTKRSKRNNNDMLEV
jgi:hypothetical protein